MCDPSDFLGPGHAALRYIISALQLLFFTFNLTNSKERIINLHFKCTIFAFNTYSYYFVFSPTHSVRYKTLRVRVGIV